MGIWLQTKVREMQADDVLYHVGGVVSEFPRCNFFMVQDDNTIVTPEKNSLHGVTRKKIIEGISKYYPIKEGVVTVNEIRNAREAFLSSSTKRVQSIVKMDDHVIGTGKPGKVTADVLKLLIELEKNYVEKKRLTANLQ